jgi:hypothetical protein
MLADELERRDRQTRLGLDERRVVAEEQRLTQPDEAVSFNDWARMTPEERAEYGQFRNIGKSETEFDRYRGMSSAERALYDQFKSVGKPEMDEPLVQVVGPAGSPIYVPRSQAVGKEAPRGPGDISADERKKAGHLRVANSSEHNVRGLEDQVGKLSILNQERLKYFPNELQTPLMQQYRQAQDTWIETVLREASGAAIRTEEYGDYRRMYFAQPGDRPEVKEQKRAARQVKLDALKYSSGRAAADIPNPAAAQGGDVVWTKVNGKWVRSQ